MSTFVYEWGIVCRPYGTFRLFLDRVPSTAVLG